MIGFLGRQGTAMSRAKFTEVFLRPRQIGGARFFGGRVIPKTNSAVQNSDLCVVRPVWAALPINDIASRDSVSRIVDIGRFTQISDGVIAAIAINMIDKMSRPIAVDVKPRQAMGLIIFTQKSNSHIAAALSVASYNALLAGATIWLSRPTKLARFGVVREPATQNLWRKSPRDKNSPSIHSSLQNRENQCGGSSEAQSC